MTRSRLDRSIAGLVLAGALAIAAPALAGCSTPQAHVTDGPSDSATPASAQQLPPIMADLGTVDGTTITVPLDNVIVLTGDKTDFKSWTAQIEDPTVVSFTPGKDDGSAQFNPGLQPISTGTTKVTLDNSVSGTHAVFTVTVTAKK
ncbi:MAG: hypothetical protein JST33_16000 [Actinobacteria bacterium]|nr:hypothetical protein [Actinomycetota bacterium]